MEDGRTGDDDAGAGRDNLGNVLLIDAAVDCHRRAVPGAIEQLADFPDFRLAARNESLTAEAGIDRHHQHVVDVGGDVFEHHRWRRRIEHHASPDTQRLDGVHRAMQMRQDLDVDRHHRRARVGKRVDVLIGIRDHQVHVDRDLRDALDRLHDRRTHGDVRHEVAVHHVDVNEIGATALSGINCVAERREIGRQD